MTDFYIPPPGVFFRLRGYSSGYVLFSRTHAEPQVFHHPQDSLYDDQFFQLIPGTGEYAGYYNIKGKATDMVLFSLPSGPIRVGHMDADIMDERQPATWFRLEPGSGKHASDFRLCNDFSGTALVSRRHEKPEVINHPATDVYDDQYFSFLFEDMIVDRVVYHVDQGKILASTPIVIATQQLFNHSNIEQSMEFTINETMTETSTFDYTLGFTVTVGASYKAGIPIVAEQEIRVDVTNSHTFQWGSTTSSSKSYIARLPVVTPPHTTARAVSSITSSIIDVPFTMYLRSASTGVEVETEGIYKGETTWDLRHEVRFL
jgi:hypothetical protein